MTIALDEAKALIARRIDAEAPRLVALSHAIHDDPELSFQEHRAAARLADALRDAGFDTKVGAYGLDTAIEATYGSGDFVVAVCAEYDALPVIGHGCGHNIIATAGLGAALGLTEIADEAGIRVKLLGTPAEEHGGGKAIMLEAGAWEDATVSLMVHGGPAADAGAADFSCQAVDRYRITFTGRGAHAAAAPEAGISALSAATLSLTAIGLLRQHLYSTTRVAAILTEGGTVTNVIPERAIIEVEIRSFDMDELADVKTRVMNCFEGSAIATGCTWERTRMEPRYACVIQEPLLAKPWDDALTELGRTLEAVTGVGGGSTDMGNVSQVVPAIHPMIAVRTTTAPPHTAAFAAAAATPDGDQTMIVGAKGLAWAAATAAIDSESRAELLARQAARPAGSTQVPAWDD
jgi:amidohydrolase